jgi:transcriptional regulator with XRE-family HTH domain
MLTHDELKTKALRNSHVRAEYNALEAEFAWLGELLQARNRAGLTQTEVAERMGTTPSAVARLEAGGGHQKHSPSIATLRKYAEAVGCMVEVKLVPCTQPAPAAVSQQKSRGRAGSGRGEQTKRTSSRSSAGRPRPNTCPEGDCQGFFTAFQD